MTMTIAISTRVNPDALQRYIFIDILHGENPADKPEKEY